MNVDLWFIGMRLSLTLFVLISAKYRNVEMEKLLPVKY